jgi:hypothetical protein
MGCQLEPMVMEESFWLAQDQTLAKVLVPALNVEEPAALDMVDHGLLAKIDLIDTDVAEMIVRLRVGRCG